MTDTGDLARRLHDEAARMDPRVVTVATVHHAFSRRLNDYNDAQVRMGLPVPALQDPRDLIGHIQALASQIAYIGGSMSTAEALGAQVTALCLSIARSEDARLDLGDAA